MSIRSFPYLMVLLLVQSTLTGTLLIAQEWKSGVNWRQPPIVTPGTTDNDPPSDAIILFDGTNLLQWKDGEKWLIEDGVAIPNEGDIKTKRKFGDIQLHVEWSSPTVIEGEGQGRGNSGVYLMDRYEVQVLDSFQNTTYSDGQAASIYKQTPPMVNAMRKPGEWNTYDIIFNTPKFRTNGALETPAYVTVIHNGVLVLNHFELLGGTSYTEAPKYEPHGEKEPISIQFHRDAVRFRNIWVRELKPAAGHRVNAPFNIEKTPPKEARAKKERTKKNAAIHKPQKVKPAKAKARVKKKDQPKQSQDTTKHDKQKAAPGKVEATSG